MVVNLIMRGRARCHSHSGIYVALSIEGISAHAKGAAVSPNPKLAPRTAKFVLPIRRLVEGGAPALMSLQQTPRYLERNASPVLRAFQPAWDLIFVLHPWPRPGRS